MRPELSNTLKTYNTEITKKTKSSADAEELKHLSNLVEANIALMAKERQSTPQAQRLIYGYQKEKRAIIQKLKKHLRRVDNGQETQEAGQRVSYTGGRLFLPDNKARDISVSELMTDGEWGVDYVLDATVPTRIKKRYLVERAKRRLRDLLDWQIFVDELSSEATDPGKHHAYEELMKTRENRDEGAAGHIAEKMVRNFLRKLAMDHELEYEVIPGDVYQDVHQKIDFIIQKKSRVRYAKVSEGKTAVGIQFTINPSPFTRFQKRKQIGIAAKIARGEEIVDDILLVQMPLTDIRKMYDTWKRAGSPPGGPDKLWDDKTKEIVFRGVMDQFLSPEEIETTWHVAVSR